MDIEKGTLGDVGEVLDGNLLQGSQLEEAIRKASAILLGTRAELRANTIKKLENCRLIVRYGVGVDNIDIGEATNQGILVANVPDYCVEEVSVHTLALILAANRRLVSANKTAVSGEWKTGMMKGVSRLSSQTLGLVGFGRIGQSVAQKAKALVGEVIAYDPVFETGLIERSGVTPVNLSNLLRVSDYISIHCPLTTETHHLFNQDTLGRMKPSAWLINTARGEIIDETALLEALQQQKIGGAALDVLTQEPPEPSSPLLEMGNVILTPHVAYYSEDAIEDLQRNAAKQVRDVIMDLSPKWVINN